MSLNTALQPSVSTSHMNEPPITKFLEYLPALVFRFLDVLYSFTCLQIVIRHTVETPVDHAVSSHSRTTI